eukprot:5452011-Pleurochrysis_carterae.AAC.1
MQCAAHRNDLEASFLLSASGSNLSGDESPDDSECCKCDVQSNRSDVCVPSASATTGAASELTSSAVPESQSLLQNDNWASYLADMSDASSEDDGEIVDADYEGDDGGDDGMVAREKGSVGAGGEAASRGSQAPARHSVLTQWVTGYSIVHKDARLWREKRASFVTYDSNNVASFLFRTAARVTCSNFARVAYGVPVITWEEYIALVQKSPTALEAQAEI